MVGKCVHDANSKRRILRVCRVYLAKRSIGKVVLHSFAQFEGIMTNRMAWIWRLADRQTDRQTDIDH